MLYGWEGNRRPGGKQWQFTAEWLTYGHLRAEHPIFACTPGSAPGPTLGIDYGKHLRLFYLEGRRNPTLSSVHSAPEKVQTQEGKQKGLGAWAGP